MTPRRDGATPDPRPDWALGLLGPEAWAVLLDQVLAGLRARGCEVLDVADGTVLVVPPGAGHEARLSVRLRNLARTAATRRPSAWPEAVADLLDAVTATVPDPVVDAGSVRVKLVLEDSLQLAESVLGPWSGGLAVAAAVDLGSSVAYLPLPRIREALDGGDVRRLGLDGLWSALAPRLVPLEGAPFDVRWARTAPSEQAVFGASTALLLDRLGIPPDPGAILALPASEACLVAPLGPAGPWDLLPWLAGLSERIARDALHPYPSALYWWNGPDRVFPIPFGEPVAPDTLGIGAVLFPHPALLERFGEPDASDGRVH